MIRPVGVKVELDDELTFAGEDAYVAVVDQHEDVASFVRAADAEVSELAGVAEGDFSGLVDAVVADAELAGVADG